MTSQHSTSSAPAPATFVTTQWTQVLLARGDSSEAKAALSDLCVIYYAPVFAFIRHRVRDEDIARDLTQEFFARLLGRHGVHHVDPARGRFRSFLLGAVKNFLAGMHQHANYLKRGGGWVPAALDRETDTSAGLQIPDVNVTSPDREFDRKWALTVLERALASLAREQHAAGKAAHFEILKPWLMGEVESLSQAGAAARLGMNEGAVKVAIHRLRRRFREAIKWEINHTVCHHSDVEDEMQTLLQALSCV